MVKYTKVRKWAESNGFQVKEIWGAYSNGDECIEIIVNEELSFELEYRKSTIYHGVKGKKGDAKGLYLREHNEKGQMPYATRQYAQTDAIESMNTSILYYNKRKANEKGA